MASLQDRRIEPSEISSDILSELDGLMNAGAATLVGSHGERIILPPALNELLVFVVASMKRRQAVILVPEDEPFTTQAAANYLGMSRPNLLKLLNANRLPFHRVGTHRRILFRDLMLFQQARNAARSKTLTEVTKLLDAEGVYDRRLEPSE